MLFFAKATVSTATLFVICSFLNVYYLFNCLCGESFSPSFILFRQKASDYQYATFACKISQNHFGTEQGMQHFLDGREKIFKERSALLRNVCQNISANNLGNPWEQRVAWDYHSKVTNLKEIKIIFL